MPVSWLPEGVNGGLYNIFKQDRRMVHLGSFAICKFTHEWQAATAKQAFWQFLWNALKEYDVYNK